MHRPRDEFERELYGEKTPVTRRITPAWQLLGLSMAAYIVAAAMVLFGQSFELSSSDLASITIFGGFLLTVGSGLLAGWVLIFAPWGLEWAIVAIFAPRGSRLGLQMNQRFSWGRPYGALPSHQGLEQRVSRTEPSDEMLRNETVHLPDADSGLLVRERSDPTHPDYLRWSLSST